MTIIFTAPRYIKVCYRTFSQVTSKGEPCGGFSYYAEAHDAADRGDYVELVVCSTETLAVQKDLLKKVFTKMQWDDVPLNYKQKYMQRVRKEWNDRSKVSSTVQSITV